MCGAHKKSSQKSVFFSDSFRDSDVDDSWIYLLGAAGVVVIFRRTRTLIAIFP